MFFSFPKLVYSCVFPTEGPQGQRGLAVPIPPTHSFFAGIVGKVLLCDVLVMIKLLCFWRSEHCKDGGVKIEVMGKE